MRSVFRRAFVALVAVFAVGVLASASASAALPEFAGLGEISSKNPVKYTFKGGEVGFYELGSQRVSCSSSIGEGSITGSKSLTAKLIFQGCKEGTTNCQSTSKLGEVVTEELKSALVYVSKATKEVGIDFNQYETKFPPRPVFATFECAGSKDGIRGGVIAPITSINTKLKAFTLKFTVSGGLQTPAEYENEKSEKIRQMLEANLVGGYPEGLHEGAMRTEGSMEKLVQGGKAIELEVKA